MEPGPERVVDNEGDTWVRFPDGYRMVQKADPPTSLDDIDKYYGIRSQA